ncbi:MAG: L-2-amino-thiazoline-4-carboxylic acid hydrolase [Alphaproteobacteria bacterium]
MTPMPNDITKEQLIAAMDRQLRIQGRLYMYLAKETIGRFAQEGEMTVRLGLRALGRWRGLEMRAAHHALGRPINMQTLAQCWDNASTFIVKDALEANGRYRPHDVRFDVPYCPASEVWKEGGFHQWGHVYCDEFHQACASTYHPDGNVVIPINMMKGDDHCHFQWIMPPEAEDLGLGKPTAFGEKLARDYKPQSELEDAWMSLRRSNRLYGGWFISLATAALERHGAEGRAAVTAALETWGADRGRRLRKAHLDEKITPSAANFIRYHDLPAREVWRTRIVEEHGARTVIEISESPQDDALADYDAGALGDLWYEASYPAMVGAYLPGSTVRWLALRGKGGDTNRLEITTARP